ncbi:hypothetical protein P2G88_18915 [Aliiglaciecola sp. CAU 1673]|uniref:hypothetical protein n=1 Tax=Aliiglaciecola sp. CAU 1673 TaxID=3032595 RepID=UPI0023DC40FA|nr:hypothetical protein [Aliiglaciecola sp. CAU 1673]MDF2180334.1 hypothetical protein [Aliiglaciecola sp. CAU 1673]
MRKLLTAVSLVAFAGLSQAGEQPKSLFKCVEAESFTVNASCMERQISQNIQFQDVQRNIVQQSANQSDAVMATIKFYPERHLIEIVAHRDALENSALLASNR